MGLDNHVSIQRDSPPLPAVLQRYGQRGYADRFKKLNEIKETTGLLALIRRIVQRIYGDYEESKLKFSVHVAVEHMSQGELSANWASAAVKEARKLLSKMTPSPAVKKVEKGLAFVADIWAQDSRWVQERMIEHKVDGLDVHEYCTLDLGTPGHAMLMVITRIPNEGGKKMFKLSIHNTGSGTTDYHNCRMQGQVLLIQTPLEITNVSIDNLVGNHLSFFKKMHSAKSVQALYEDVLPLAGGELLPPANESSIYWRLPQSGGSCTASCIRSVIASLLPKEENEKFEELARYELFLRTYQEILEGSGNTTTQKIVALDMVKMIQHSFEGGGMELPEELRVARSKLEAMVNGKGKKSRLDSLRREVQSNLNSGSFFKKWVRSRHVVKLNGLELDKSISVDAKGHFSSLSLSDYLNFSLSALKEENYAELEEYLIKAKEFIYASQKLNHQEIEKLARISRIIKTYENKPLNKEGSDNLTAISAMLVLAGNSVRKQPVPPNDSKTSARGLLNRKIEALRKENISFFYGMHLRFNAAPLKYPSGGVQAIITTARSTFTIKDMPAGKKEFIARMKGRASR